MNLLERIKERREEERKKERQEDPGSHQKRYVLASGFTGV
jgi:hypothetical protein